MRETTMVDGMENEIRCKNYLASLSVDISRDLAFWGHYTKLNVHAKDLFHQIAQATRTKEIKERLGGLSFIIEVPHNKREEASFPHTWTVALTEEETPGFLNKYKGEYRIINKF